MKQEEPPRTLLQRYGGHLVLIFLGGMLILSQQATSQGISFEFGLVESLSSMSLLPTAVAPVSAPAVETVRSPTSPEANANLPSLPLLQDNSLAPILNPHTFEGKKPAHQFQVHVVERGDTPNRIAERYGIKAETLLGGNPWLSQESNALQTGVELTILPVDGLLHEVREGETLESIAEKYQVPVADIIGVAGNNLEFPYRLYAETELLIPGAVQQLFVWSAPALSSGSGGSGRPGFVPLAFGTGTFQWPVSGRCLTTRFWAGHPGIDVSLAIGTPVYAADTGTVTYASWAAGTYWDYGNLIVINHGNSYETFYAHLNDITVYPGQAIYKGNYIAASGSTGRSSGPHLHLEIRYNNVQLDPLSLLGGATQDCR
jgi:LysM repeat protein